MTHKSKVKLPRVIVDLCESTERAFLSVAEPGVVRGAWGEKLGHSLNGWMDVLGERPGEGAHPEAGPAYI